MRILLLVVALTAPAAAEDVLDWTPADAALVVAVRGSPAGMLQGLEKRFGDVKRIKDAIGRLRAWEIKGVRPLSGDPGGTIALSRGVGLFVRGPKQARLVIGADDAAQSLAAGELIPQTNPQTIADGLLTSLGDLTWPIIRDHVEAVITVEDEAIVEAMRLLWERAKLVVEPSGAVGLAAALTSSFQSLENLQQVAVVLTGGNVNLDQLPW